MVQNRKWTHLYRLLPNTPVEDIDRIAATLARVKPALLIRFGRGSTINASKAAIVQSILKETASRYYGVEKVSETCVRTGTRLTPHLAIQTVASSAAHLTKYTNVTNLETRQKKLSSPQKLDYS